MNNTSTCHTAVEAEGGVGTTNGTCHASVVPEGFCREGVVVGTHVEGQDDARHRANDSFLVDCSDCSDAEWSLRVVN